MIYAYFRQNGISCFRHKLMTFLSDVLHLLVFPLDLQGLWSSKACCGLLHTSLYCSCQIKAEPNICCGGFLTGGELTVRVHLLIHLLLLHPPRPGDVALGIHWVAVVGVILSLYSSLKCAQLGHLLDHDLCLHSVFFQTVKSCFPPSCFLLRLAQSLTRLLLFSSR